LLRRPLAVFIFLVITGMIVGATWWFGYRAALFQVADRGTANLQSVAARLVGQLAPYRLMAVRLSDHPDVVALARGAPMPENIERLFLRAADESGALEVAYFDTDGVQLATSLTRANVKHDSDTSTFDRALTGALGVGHGRAPDGETRAFTFMAPVFVDALPTGALAVRVDMEAIEESDWRGAPEIAFFTDEEGDIFVTNRSELLLQKHGTESDQSFGPLRVFNVAGIPVWSVDGHKYIPQRVVYRKLPLPVIDMTGHLLINTQPAEQIATLQAAVIGALCLAFGAFLFLATERRRALALANAGLEVRVAERTQELARVNVNLRHEITERKDAEQALRKAQSDLVQAGKLSALGQMSAGISHELNQPLMAIRSFSENAEQFLDKDNAKQARENLSRISDLSRRMARIIKNLRAFARQESEPMTNVDIVAVVNSVLDMSHPRIVQDDIDVQWTPSKLPVLVHGGEVRLQQVFLNLLTNAIDAMSLQSEKRLEIDVLSGADNVRVSVRDTGPGLDDPGKIFDPFYTTKTVGQSEDGMGLGLSISYGLVQSFGGAIQGRNHSDGGAVFTVDLARPAQEDAP